jgi:hypothetical protein
MEGALRLLDGLRNDVEVVTDGDDGEQQDQGAGKRADNQTRTASAMAGRYPTPPQQVGGQQEG